MGVDYTAFVCWGQRVTGQHRLHDAFEDHCEVLNKHRIGYAQYGSSNYGGDGGFILIADDTYTEVDFDYAPMAKPLPKDRHWNQVDAVMRIQDVVHELKKLGVEISAEGEPGWFVCGLVH